MLGSNSIMENPHDDVTDRELRRAGGRGTATDGTCEEVIYPSGRSAVAAIDGLRGERVARTRGGRGKARALGRGRRRGRGRRERKKKIRIIQSGMRRGRDSVSSIGRYSEWVKSEKKRGGGSEGIRSRDADERRMKNVPLIWVFPSLRGAAAAEPRRDAGSDPSRARRPVRVPLVPVPRPCPFRPRRAQSRPGNLSNPPFATPGFFFLSFSFFKIEDLSYYQEVYSLQESHDSCNPACTNCSISRWNLRVGTGAKEHFSHTNFKKYVTRI